MKAALNELESCFELSLEPETLKEASEIIRLGMNGKKEILYVSADIYTDHSIGGYIRIGKRKKPRSQV